MNLFASMILQAFVRLVIYVDQMVVRQQKGDSPQSSTSGLETQTNVTSGGGNSNDEVWGIDNTVSIDWSYHFTNHY